MKGLLAERLSALRKANSMTATQCAAELEISTAAWSQWEKAKRDPPLEVLPKICWMFGVSMNTLFDIQDKSCGVRNVSVKTAAGGVSIGCGSGNVVRGTIVAGGDYGNAAACAKCPFKKKLKALEKLIQK